MTRRRFSLVARINTDSPAAVRPVLENLFGKPSVRKGTTADEFVVEAETTGANAKELNRALLSELRRTEKKTRLRAEWTTGGMTERFFDYVSKGTGPKQEI